MNIENLVSELKALQLFADKNESEFKRIIRVLNQYFDGATIIEEFFILSEFDLLDNDDYLIIFVVENKNLLEISFNTLEARVDILPLSTIRRIEITEAEAQKKDGMVTPPIFTIKIYHDAGTGAPVITGVAAEGNEVSKLKKFTEKIRKKVLSM